VVSSSTRHRYSSDDCRRFFYTCGNFAEVQNAILGLWSDLNSLHLPVTHFAHLMETACRVFELSYLFGNRFKILI